MSYDVIIPARDEASTVAEVVRAARAARGAGRVIVVNDHSCDHTARLADEAGAEVITSAGHGSKAMALATGTAASCADVLVFFDADILAATPTHFDALADPVLGGYFVMCCGMVDYGAMRNAFYMRLPPITGLRAIRREIFDAVAGDRRNGFQIEIMINEVVARRRLPSAIRILKGARHRSKVAKLGLIRGTSARLSMAIELLDCLTFVPLWTYGSYLRHLTVLRSDSFEHP